MTHQVPVQAVSQIQSPLGSVQEASIESPAIMRPIQYYSGSKFLAHIRRLWCHVRKAGSQEKDIELSAVHGASIGWQQSPPARDTSVEAVLQAYATLPTDSALGLLQTQMLGLLVEEAAERLGICGPNILSSRKPLTWWQLLLSILPNPFNVLLALLAVISVATPPPNWSTFTILVVMIVISCGVRFWQEYRSNVAAINLQSNVRTDIRVQRQSGYLNARQVLEIIIDEKALVPGDIVLVDSGDCIPADCLVVEATNLQISQSSLTGESEAVQKCPSMLQEKNEDLFELKNILLMGTSVISGSGKALVLKTGDNAFLATIMKQLNKRRPVNAFQRGIRDVSYMLMIFMVVMVPIVLVVSGKISGDWRNAALFSIAVAVGLVPEMLPAIVNANLARGAFELAKRKAIVKRLDAIQNLGGMSVLCSDKTGTLTKDEILLYQHLDSSGTVDQRTLELAYINAVNQSGKKNSIDSAIVNKFETTEQRDLAAFGQKVAEISFTFEKRRSSCIMNNPRTGNFLLICKGAFEEVLDLCTRIRTPGGTSFLDTAARQEVSRLANKLNAEGYRVILVATRELQSINLYDDENVGTTDSDMTLEGLLTFLDPPKDDAAYSIERLQNLGVEVKVLTGDNLGVAMKICRSLNLVDQDCVEEGGIQAITGPDLARLQDRNEFDEVVKSCKVFAKLTPAQKGQIVLSLKRAGHAVGMLGDGINDCVALRFADAGISVNTGASVAKDCADVILTVKELSIIVDCVTIGRLTHGNTIKYIKMVASSNFGNVFSILIASAWLPYQPMTSLQILIQNLLYDVSQTAVPWDRVDEEYLRFPQKWDTKDLLRFILVLGPTSSTIDMCTFALNWFYYNIRSASNPELVAQAQTQWFLEGLLTQTLIVHLLRTAKVPVFQSRAAHILVATTVGIIFIGFLVPYVPPFRASLAMAMPAHSFVGFLALELVLYSVEVQLVKMAYIWMFGRWL